VVLDVATNNGLGASQTELANTATHNNGGVDPDFAFSAGGTSVTVIEPELMIEKNASALVETRAIHLSSPSPLVIPRKATRRPMTC
jgi:hypothetical protein